MAQSKLQRRGHAGGHAIEDASISVDDKVSLLDALSETGLQQIVIGSFVSPKWTPQMERIDEIVTKFNPKPGSPTPRWPSTPGVWSGPGLIPHP